MVCHCVHAMMIPEHAYCYNTLKPASHPYQSSTKYSYCTDEESLDDEKIDWQLRVSVTNDEKLLMVKGLYAPSHYTTVNDIDSRVRFLHYPTYCSVVVMHYSSWESQTQPL